MNRFKKVNTKPLNEAQATLATLKDLLNSKKDSERTFAKQKLRAYENAEVLKSGVRVKRKGEVKAAIPSVGDSLTVRYVGSRADGRFFDSGNFTFTLGKGEVIKAWDDAFKVIKEGQDATIFCPSPTAYGKRGAGKLIPGNTTLIFDVSLLKVVKQRE
jgi:FKBP-type peptidyl-prolyl cis-trans isomerase